LILMCLMFYRRERYTIFSYVRGISSLLGVPGEFLGDMSGRRQIASLQSIENPLRGLLELFGVDHHTDRLCSSQLNKRICKSEMDYIKLTLNVMIKDNNQSQVKY
jgi:hypothetical protein